MEQRLPFSTTSKDAQLYSLPITICPHESEAKQAPFFCAAVFPWRKNSLQEELYKVLNVDDTTVQSNWNTMVSSWGGAIIVGSTGCFLVFRRPGCGDPICVKIPRPPDWNRTWNVRNVAWAINPIDPSHPVVIASVASVLFVVDLNTLSIVGRIRGHGDDITSIAVHPAFPYLFLSTSKDGTTRIYDLTYNSRQGPNNPHWPPAIRQSLAGPAFGLHMSESEGDGLGRCVAVLVGGRSGGHQSTVFHAAWHPSADLIATCGMDRCVKIWRLPHIDYAKVDAGIEHLVREDKPLFSTDLIHKARVLSISWLSSEILVSHSAPALMRGETSDEYYDIPGTIAVWMWLSFSRFLPDGHVRKGMRGCQSDYRNSGSFKVLSEYSLPLCPTEENPLRQAKVSVYAPIVPRRQKPLLLVDAGSNMHIFSIAEFSPRIPPPFPPDLPELESRGPQVDVQPVVEVQAEKDSTDRELAEVTGRMDLNQENEDDEGEDGEDEVYRRDPGPRDLVEAVPHWTVPKEVSSEVTVDRCQMVFGGRMIVSVSERGRLSIWKMKTA